jgi:glutamate 5-kinase
MGLFSGRCKQGEKRASLSNILVKKGTSSIVDETTHEPLLPILTLIVDTAVKLRKDGHRVVIVSSGAIGVGLRRMDVAKRPKHLAQLQASSFQFRFEFNFYILTFIRFQ